MCMLCTRPLVRDWMVAGVDAYAVGGSRGTRQPKQVEGRQEVQTLCTPGSAVDASPSGAVEGTPRSASAASHLVLPPCPPVLLQHHLLPPMVDMARTVNVHPRVRALPALHDNGVPCTTQEDNDNALSAVLLYLSVYLRGFLHACKPISCERMHSGLRGEASVHTAAAFDVRLERTCAAQAGRWHGWRRCQRNGGGVGGMGVSVGMWERTEAFLSEGSAHAAVFFDVRLERTCVARAGGLGGGAAGGGVGGMGQRGHVGMCGQGRLCGRARGHMWAEMHGRGCLGACGQGRLGVGGVWKPVQAQAWEEELAWQTLSVRRKEFAACLQQPMSVAPMDAFQIAILTAEDIHRYDLWLGMIVMGGNSAS
ncbi:hypothetical protein B0H10DRAFT_1955048 [Mycena sp. CBHHK59/15]|nr:hypothetical protein B0H10DRAFT_1955048 [Mycena sp. CBHHK59/15]